MDYPEALQRAAALYGIEPEYTDTWGRRHTPSEDTTKRILSAIGVPAGSAEEIERFLHERETAQWSRALDPVIVVREDAAAIALRIPAGRAGASVKLELEWEGGDLQHHWFWLPELKETGRAHSFIEKRLPLPKPLRPGYHHARIYWMKEPQLEVFGQARFIVCPERAYDPGGRMAGIALSLYGLRSARNWGVGDFTDLRAAIDAFAPAGVAFLSLNPLHAIANRNPYNVSPYLPESSLYRNFLYLDVEKTPGYRSQESWCEEIEVLRASEFVEYERVAQIKLQALGEAFGRFWAAGGSAEFDSFVQTEGSCLERYAVYCALSEEMHRRDPNIWVWPQWPPAYQDPRSEAVARFAQEHHQRVLFYKFLQWQIDRQLAGAQAHARERGMRIGLYHDLALATDRYGSDLWARREFYISGCSVGAPPDQVAPGGQNWGFPPPDSEAHRQDGYELFARTIRNCARHGGALRIDHVMRLFRLFWIPDGLTPAEGAYVRDRPEDLLGILTLESVRNGFAVIGEDLGTVEEQVRQRLGGAGILGYRLLWFERNNDGSFRAARDYPVQAAVSTTTHDLPTLAGFFQGRDIEARRQAGLVDEAAYQEQWSDRRRDIELLNAALTESGFPGDALGFVLATPCEMAIVNQEDLTGETEQQNLPASTWQYPNWQRKMRVPVEDLGPIAETLRRKIAESRRAG